MKNIFQFICFGYINAYLNYVALMLILSGCGKDKSILNNNNNPIPLELPPITTTGENTFGCKVNGEIWLPDVTNNLVGIRPIEADYYNGELYVNGKISGSDNSKDQAIGINVFSNFSIDDTMLLTWPHIWPSTQFKKARGLFHDYIPGNCEYETDTLHEGYLKILRLDSIDRIISGTFAFKAYSSSCNTVVDITDGRFDVKY